MRDTPKKVHCSSSSSFIYLGCVCCFGQKRDTRFYFVDERWFWLFFCVLDLISFGNAVGAMYVREYFEEAARQSMNEMVKDIRSVFSEIIDELEWMDDETRARAKGKSDSMTTHIAYPDELLDDKKLIDLYENVNER